MPQPWSAILSAVMLLAMSTPAFAEKPENKADVQRMIVTLAINGRIVDEYALALKTPSGFYIARALLDQRFSVSPQAEKMTEAGADYIALSTLPGVSVFFDEAKQELQLKVSLDALKHQVIDMSPETQKPHYAQTTGVFLNYDALAQFGEAKYATVMLDGGAAVASGALISDALVQQTQNGFSFTRLESSWLRDFPAAMLQIKIGDGTSRGGDWGQPNRFGGLQIATNFAVQPGFISFPLPVYSGQAALPSTVDVFVSNMLRSHSSVDQGPFSITQIPTITGGGDANIVVTDLLGRQQVVTLPFYVAPTLLKQGLSDFSYEAGWMRLNLGAESDDYGRLIASATHRYGLTDTLTAEGHVEIIGPHRAGGGGLIANVPGLGVVEGDAAYGGDDHHRGVLLALSYARVMQGWNAGVSQRWLSYGYAAAQYEPGTTTGQQHAQTVISLGRSLSAYGSVSASLTRETFVSTPVSKLASVTWTKPLTQKAFISAYITRAQQATGNTTFGVSFSLLLGGGNSGSAETDLVDRRPQAILTARHNDGPDSGWTYGATLSRGDIDRIDADMVYRTAAGDFGVEGDDFTGRVDTRLTASGSFAFADGAIFASRRLDDAFAIVSVPGFPGITITQENRPVGKTDDNGRVLLPRLISYYPNKIGLDGGGLPIDVDLDQLEQTVTPSYRSAVILKFDAHADGRRLISIRRPNGEPIAPGVQIVRLSDGKVFRSGFDGQAFVDLAPGPDGARFTVADAPEACRFTLPKAMPKDFDSLVLCDPAVKPKSKR